MKLSLLLLATTSAPALSAPLVTVNTTSALSGDRVLVSWESALTALYPSLALSDLENQTMKTEWYEDQRGTHKCRVVYGADTDPKFPLDGSGPFWLGQFSPAVASLSDIKMTGDPNAHAVTEGTPPFTTPAPVKFLSGTQLSKGNWTFAVTNMRTTVNWVLFEGSMTAADTFKPLALSAPVMFKDANRPMHARIARTPSTGEMRVSWTAAPTPTETPGQQLARKSARRDRDRDGDAYSTIQWGLSADNLNRSQTATTSTYAASDLCGAPANSSGFHDPGVFYTTVLDLSNEPEQERLEGLRYYYRFGGDTEGWSPVRSFPAPKPVNPHASLSIAVTADMGETYEDGSQYHWEEPAAVNTTDGLLYLTTVEGGGVDVLMHPGDLSYATGYESEWDRFMEQIEPIAGTVPYMTGQGNHERDFPNSGNFIGSGDSGGECGVPTQARFNMPVCAQPNTEPCVGSKASELASELPRRAGAKEPAVGLGPVGSANDGWYSFEQGPVHFVNLNTEMSSLNGSRQFQFVQNDLASVNRSNTPWVLIFGHRQMYSANSMGPQNQMGDLEPLLMQYKVDLALWGHIHFAQQSCPMYHAKCVNETDAAGYDAPVHVVIGNAGQSLTKFPPEKDRAPWSLYQGEEWGFSHIAVHNATDLTFTFYGDNAVASGPPPVHHQFDLSRKFPRV